MSITNWGIPQRVNLVAGDNRIDLGDCYRHLRYWVDSGGPDLHPHYADNAASASMAKIESGWVVEDEFAGGIRIFHVFASAAGVLNVQNWA